MKIIQSFWSDPFIKNEENTWLNKKIFLLSQVISLYKLLKLNYSVDFYTDDYGKNLFINYLKLPFSNVYTILNNLNDTHLWTQGKIKTYLAQKESFIHLDSDVFLGEKLILPNKNNFIFCQSYYSRKQIKKQLEQQKNLPEFISEKDETSICMGIFATDNLDLIKNHAELYFKYAKEWKISENLKQYRNTILEEWLLTILANKNNINIEYLFNIDSNLYLKKWKLMANKINYSHIGSIKKTKNKFFSEMEKYVSINHPIEYEKIQKITI